MKVTNQFISSLYNLFKPYRNQSVKTTCLGLYIWYNKLSVASNSTDVRLVLMKMSKSVKSGMFELPGAHQTRFKKSLCLFN